MACPLHCQGQGTCFGLPHSRPAFLQDLFQQFIQHPMMLIAASWSCRLERPKAVALMGWPWSARAHGCGVEGREREREATEDGLGGRGFMVCSCSKSAIKCMSGSGWMGWEWGAQLRQGANKISGFFYSAPSYTFSGPVFCYDLLKMKENALDAAFIDIYPCLVPVGRM